MRELLEEILDVLLSGSLATMVDDTPVLLISAERANGVIKKAQDYQAAPRLD